MNQPSIFDFDLANVETLESVSREQFDHEIRPAGRPVILRNQVRDWPIIAAARTSYDTLSEYLNHLDVGASVPTFVARPEAEGRYFYTSDMRRFTFETRDIPFRAVIDKLIDQKDEARPLGIYAGASPTVNTLPEFSTDNDLDLIDEHVVPKVWVGNSATIAPHFDVSENIACAVSGIRQFVIFPPDQISNLYVGPIDYNMAGQPASLVDLNAIDLEKFPKFQAAIQTAALAELQPGDALYLPSLWWHFVVSKGPLNILVNYWFDRLQHGSPMNVLALALLVIRDLPEADRAAWRSVFDHYIFGANALRSVDHVPEEFRGVLAGSSSTRDSKLKTFLKAQLPSVLR